MIDILMATYNGAKFIGTQIDSILNQNYKEWKLYIRDDGSKDNSVEIIKSYQEKYPEKIILIEDEKRGLGAKLNFAELLKYSKSEYCMFCDQDDFWLENKISSTLEKMKLIEETSVHNTPILVHTDLKVVDEDLEIINNSFFEYQKLNYVFKDLNHLLVQNNITGCTMMMNRPLLDMIDEVPAECIMHDWWIGLVASAFGKIGYLSEPTILYRQHGNNEVGAHKYNSIGYLKNKASNINKINNSINDSIKQANKFYDKFGSKLDDKDKKVVNLFVEIRNKNIISRKNCVIKNKFLKSGFVRNIGYLTFI